MSTKPYLITTPRWGGTGGTTFDDSPPDGDFSTAAINKIIIRHGGVIDSLEVYYSWNKGVGITHGGPGGIKVELTFEPGEFITRVEGRADKTYIIQLEFITNKRRWGPYGAKSGTKFSWGTTDETYPYKVPPMRLIAIAGSAGPFLYWLQAIFTDYREPPLKSVNYESISITQGDSPSVYIPKFTSHLMSPIITLLVGQSETKVEFHAYEDTLCQVPFFKAALLGEFKEAVQKTIELPEDDPDKISCLIEYLYTGNYTYAFNPTVTQLDSQGESNVPTGDLKEGLFHVGVYAIAAKYICPGLVELAKRNFIAVLDEVGDIDKLRLWKAAYDEGIHLRGQGLDFQQYRSGKGFVAWVRWLFREHSAEMEVTVSEYPTLACDLLRITTGVD